jgi:hypothetical protein
MSLRCTRKSAFRLLASLSVVSLALIATLSAQPPPGGRGPGFRMAGGGPASVVALIGLPEVQQELKASPEQAKALAEFTARFQEQMQTVFRDFGPPPFDAPPEEREKHFAEMRAKMETLDQQAEKEVAKLIEPQQLDRFQQLRLQRSGAQGILRPEIAEKLALSDEQKGKLEGLQNPGFGPPRFDPQAIADALAILDDKQKTTWRELTGPEFKFPEPRGFGGPGGMFGGPERKLVKEFDKNNDGWLNAEERKEARVSAKAGARGPGGRGPGPGGPGGFGPGGRDEEGKPGPKVAPDDVQPVASADLYDPSVLRTLFLDFENADWEAEMADFHNTDVEMPATLTVDGKQYPHVGVHFRGMSSYGMVRAGSKRSLNVSLDLVDPQQRLYGYKTLNLLNSHEDPSFLHTVLYSHVAREHIAAPKANLVKVVINGESWGVYVNSQQFDKIFAEENFKGVAARWKVRGSPGGGGGLAYSGDNIEDYKRRYEIKSADRKKDWEALVKLCRTLNETPAEDLEKALEPMLDIEGTLWFLALENALINCDGYWIRASDYSIARDDQGKFHMVPHDMNETFQPPMGPGFGGPGGRRPGGRGPGGRGPGERRGEGRGPGPGGRGPEGSAPPANPEGEFALDPLVGLDDNSKPLRSKLLAVPSLREKYLRYVRTIAEDSLDWRKLGPLVEQYEALIAKEIEADTRKLTSFTAFEQAIAETADGSPDRRHPSLFNFAQGRRKYLLEKTEAK